MDPKEGEITYPTLTMTSSSAPKKKQERSSSMEALSPYGVSDELAKHGVSRLATTSEDYKDVTWAFLAGLGPTAAATTVVAVLEKEYLNDDDWLQPYEAGFFELVQRRGVHLANLAYAYHGTSRDGFVDIIRDGFSVPEVTEPFYGVGSLHLSPLGHSLGSAINCVKDEDGLRHVLQCCVMRGKVEEVKRDSNQIVPSSEEFDSGVDNLVSPTKYIIWNGSINIHVVPRFIIIYSSPDLDDPNESKMRISRSPPTLELITFPELLSKLSDCLNPQRMTLIVQNYHDFLDLKVNLQEMVRILRELAGDKLLERMIKSKS